MKWFILPATIMAVALGSTTANAELFNRAPQLSELHASIPTLLEDSAPVVESSDAMATPALPQEVIHYGDDGVRFGHGTGCCQEEIGFARSLWSCYCGQKRTRHISCKASSKCRPARCGVKAKCCKTQFCWPKFDFHWARCKKPVCQQSCFPKPACGWKPFHHHQWTDRGHGCHECGQAECGGCSKHAQGRRPLWSYKWFSRMPGCCSLGCTDCGMSMSSYKANEGEIWSDAEEIKSSLSAPTPEPATNKASTRLDNKSARLWSIPKALQSWPKIFDR